MSSSNTDATSYATVYGFVVTFSIGLISAYVLDGVPLPFEVAVLGYLGTVCILLTLILVQVSE